MKRVVKLLNELIHVAHFGGIKLAIAYAACITKSWPDIIKTKSLAPADKLMPRNLEIRNKQNTVRLRSGDFGVVREIFGSRCYAHKNWINQSRTFLDLGANEGVFTLFALSSNLNNTVISIEAQSKLVQILNDNLALNKFTDRCTLRHGYVGNSNDQIRELATTSAHIDLNTMIAMSGNIDFLKVDIEGSEFALFRHSPQWARSIRYIAMEVHPSAGDVTEIINQTSALGFRVSSQSQHNNLGYLFLENTTLMNKTPIEV